MCCPFHCTISVCNLCVQTENRKRKFQGKKKKNSQVKLADEIKISSKMVFNMNREKLCWKQTLTVPEQAQGASKLLQLSNSCSWHILHTDITEEDLKSSMNNTISLMLFKLLISDCFFVLSVFFIFFCSVLYSGRVWNLNVRRWGI